jgi:hypothetical protein
MPALLNPSHSDNFGVIVILWHLPTAFCLLLLKTRDGFLPADRRRRARRRAASLLSGHYEYEWDASELASGVYFYRLDANNHLEIKKCLLLK